MASLEHVRVSVAKAAFLSGVPLKEVNREIDAKIISASGDERRLRGTDLVYLRAIKDLRNHVDPALRRHLRKAIAAAVEANRPVAHYATLEVPIQELRRAVLGSVEQLERLIADHVERRKEVLNGEPVVRGTRIAVRHVSDLVRQGASVEELQDDLDLSEPDIRAAVAYAQTHPQRGRPASRKNKTIHVPPA